MKKNEVGEHFTNLSKMVEKDERLSHNPFAREENRKLCAAESCYFG